MEQGPLFGTAGLYDNAQLAPFPAELINKENVSFVRKLNPAHFCDITIHQM